MKKKQNKIGIMSMQRILNYGSFLQAYGLKKMIEDLGKEVEFVDYHVGEPIIGSNNKENKLNRIFKKIKETLYEDGPITHKISYMYYKSTFSSKYLHLLGITEKRNFNPELDCLVIGSDEVFNCIQENTNVGYSLELFGKENNADKLISYAGSFGNTTLDKLKAFGKEDEICHYLRKFDAISVRDSNSFQLVYDLIGEKPFYNLDPVLMYDFNKGNILPEINIKEKYLILYAYSGRISSEESKWISTYAKSKNLKIYSIGGVQGCADKFINCSPFEVLSYFKNAEEVITDTFHGSIFSIINSKKFTTLVRKSKGNGYGNEEKLSDLLKRFDLEDRMTLDIKHVKTINNTEVDWNKIKSIILEQRENTEKYLKNELI